MKIRIEKEVMYTQTKGCWGCIHIGEIAIFIGDCRKDKIQGWRLELFTPCRKFRFSK